ncbi:MAG TPA: hypothetical protein VM536_20230, partial [Chloroflexia bacterium]|nr:hypothetical protein [Chloroflexia bacterium]
MRSKSLALASLLALTLLVPGGMGLAGRAAGAMPGPATGTQPVALSAAMPAAVGVQRVGLGGSTGPGARAPLSGIPVQGTPTSTPGACAPDYVYTVSTGTIVPGVLDIGNHTDDGSTFIALPFAYTLYDQAFAGVKAGSNGHLTFGTVNDTYSPSCIPVGGATYAIGPYWTDQCTGDCSNVTCTGCGIYTSTS